MGLLVFYPKSSDSNLNITDRRETSFIASSPYSELSFPPDTLCPRRASCSLTGAVLGSGLEEGTKLRLPQTGPQLRPFLKPGSCVRLLLSRPRGMPEPAAQRCSIDFLFVLLCISSPPSLAAFLSHLRILLLKFKTQFLAKASINTIFERCNKDETNS